MKIESSKWIFSSIFVLAAILNHNGCQSLDDQSLIKEDLKKEALVAADSMEVPQELDPRLSESTARVAELENRLENLVSVLEEKEQTLISRENKLLELDHSLDEKAAILAEKEMAVRRLETMSWIILAIGLFGMVAGFVVIRHYFKKQASLDSVVEVNDPIEPVKSDLKSEDKKEIKATAVVKKPTQTRKRQVTAAKPKPKTVTKPIAESKPKPKTATKSKTESKPKTKPKVEPKPKPRTRKTTPSTKKKSTDE